jgi:hypothetical protein
MSLNTHVFGSTRYQAGPYNIVGVTDRSIITLMALSAMNNLLNIEEENKVINRPTEWSVVYMMTKVANQHTHHLVDNRIFSSQTHLMF